MCYSCRLFSHKGDTVPVNSVSSWLPATACHVQPGLAGLTPASHVRARGRAWLSHVLWGDWLEVSGHSALALLVRHTACGLRGFGSPNVGLTEGVNILASKIDHCQDINRGIIHFICLAIFIDNICYKIIQKYQIAKIIFEMGYRKIKMANVTTRESNSMDGPVFKVLNWGCLHKPSV